jgi:hypothetical protein
MRITYLNGLKKRRSMWFLIKLDFYYQKQIFLLISIDICEIKNLYSFQEILEESNIYINFNGYYKSQMFISIPSDIVKGKCLY